ncbi:MarR family winged helix-turn-helix transcriptional regulator [Anaerosporobacter sp.]|uniref:MarR family winged helix-turn-helix transcriptional regulator n=1 Tax=Anaerosporobacter sp. TaxID=1872529 RepID=UPI00286EC465|nr:MarR family transcriptional regulator [Anaerosporobacter sp.]
MDAYTTFHETLVGLFNDIMELEQKAIITEQFKNITNNDMHIIEAIGDKAAKNMSSVAKVLKVTVGTLTIAINSLVKKGYVNRIRSEKDKRVVLISLSELGKEAYVHHKDFHEKMIKAMIEGLGEQETNTLVQALTNLNRFFKNYQNDK